MKGGLPVLFFAIVVSVVSAHGKKEKHGYPINPVSYTPMHALKRILTVCLR